MQFCVRVQYLCPICVWGTMLDPEPCPEVATSVTTSDHMDNIPSTITALFRSVRNIMIHSSNFLPLPKFFNFRSSTVWYTLSKTLAKSRWTTSAELRSSSFSIRCEWCCISWHKHDLSLQNPCWLSSNKWSSSMYRRNFSITILSKVFTIWEVRVMTYNYQVCFLNLVISLLES